MSGNKTIIFLRPNGGSKVTSKTLDAITDSARHRNNQVECIFNSEATIGNLDLRKENAPHNLKFDVKDTQFLIGFPGSTPRGF